MVLSLAYVASRYLGGRIRIVEHLTDLSVSLAGYGWWPINVSLGCEASLVLVAFFYVLSGKSRHYLSRDLESKNKTPLYFSYFTSRVPTTFSFSPSESHIVFAINDSPISVRFRFLCSVSAALPVWCWLWGSPRMKVLASADVGSSRLTKKNNLPRLCYGRTLKLALLLFSELSAL